MPASSVVDLGAPQGAPDKQVLAAVDGRRQTLSNMSAYCYELGFSRLLAPVQ